MADNLDGQFAELVVIAVGECLRWCHDDALTGMDAQRVEVFHVADRDAIIETVAHYFVFHLLPSLQTLLYENLRREGEGLIAYGDEFLLIVAESRTQSSKGVSGTDDDRITEFCSRCLSLFEGVAGMALDGVDTDFIEPFHEELAVFRVDDGLNRCA